MFSRIFAQMRNFSTNINQILIQFKLIWNKILTKKSSSWVYLGFLPPRHFYIRSVISEDAYYVLDDFMNIGMKKNRYLVFLSGLILLLFIDRIKSKNKNKSIFLSSYDRTTLGCTKVRQKDVAFCQSQRRGQLSFSTSYEPITLVSTSS